ncbi:hypothetical protein FS749_010548 [Ceratobasidium sp. UAMH 11750]|nr:hypothetical protein FS749_010548 [Ceratobasidium sp. UAMH 11750]
MMLYFRKGLLKFRPSVTLEKGKTHTWSHYGSSRRKQLHDYMYDRYPFLQHFSDESGEDCWVITMMAQRYLGGSGSYLRKEGKTGGRGKNIGEEEEEEEEEVAEEDRELGGPEVSAIDPDDYEDDYAANTSHHPANAHAPRARPQTAQPSSSRPRTNVAEPSHASAAQPTSTQRENRRADKVVAEEEARAKAAEARAKDKGQSLAVTSSKAKGKRRADPPRQPTPPPPSIPRRNESDDDELVIRTFSKKVKAGPRNQARITSPEASPAPATTNKKGKAAQAPNIRKNCILHLNLSFKFS